jgi:hypothetical protein
MKPYKSTSPLSFLIGDIDWISWYQIVGGLAQLIECLTRSSEFKYQHSPHPPKKLKRLNREVEIYFGCGKR